MDTTASTLSGQYLPVLSTKTNLEAALAYAANGFPVFPLHWPTEVGCSCEKATCTNVGKHPLTRHGFMDATTDKEQIKSWLEAWPSANIGMPTGKASGFAVVDCDAEAAIRSFCLDRFPGAQNTRSSRTGRGAQFFFQYQDGIRNDTGKKLGPKIDVRGDGGYVILPPSLHANGRRYEWLNENKLLPLPPSLLEILRNSPACIDEAESGQRFFDTAGALAGVPLGQRDETIFKLACTLQGAGVPKEMTQKLVDEAARNCVPPFDERMAQEKVTRAYAEYEPRQKKPAAVVPLAQRRTMKQEPFWHKDNYHVLSWTTSRLGVTAQIAGYSDGEELIRDSVKLFDLASREKFGHRYFDEMQTMERERRAAFVKKVEAELRAIADVIAEQAQAQINPEELTQIDELPQMTAEERERALVLLKDPALLFMALTTMKQSGIVGEEKNLLTLYIVMTSRLLPTPLSAAIKGESSAGKSAIDKTVRRLFPENEAFYYWSAISKQMLVYSDKQYGHKMLVFAESVGAEEADFYLRTILSENKLIFEVTEKDPNTQKSITRRIEKNGPTGVITTTTLSRLHPENETRLLTLAIDESEQQTRLIKEYTAAQFEDEKPELNFGLWVNAQRVLEPVEVKIPYARYLLERLPDKPLRIRRDCQKLLNFISASAALHQFQRRRATNGNVIANLADYFNAKLLFENIFFQSLYGTHPNTRALMNAIVDLTQGGGLGDEITTKDLAEQLGWVKSKISKWAGPLRDYGWVTPQGKGKESFYHVGRYFADPGAALPSLEDMAEGFPELVDEFAVVDPLTGAKVRLQEQENDDQPRLGVHSVLFEAIDSQEGE